MSVWSVISVLLIIFATEVRVCVCIIE